MNEHTRLQLLGFDFLDHGCAPTAAAKVDGLRLPDIRNIAEIGLCLSPAGGAKSLKICSGSRKYPIAGEMDIFAAMR
jgi:hypothetical protein